MSCFTESQHIFIVNHRNDVALAESRLELTSRVDDTIRVALPLTPSLQATQPLTNDASAGLLHHHIGQRDVRLSDQSGTQVQVKLLMVPPCLSKAMFAGRVLRLEGELLVPKRMALRASSRRLRA